MELGAKLVGVLPGSTGTESERETLSRERVASPSARKQSQAVRGGSLIINADDWGRDRETTDRIRECYERGGISSTSAMMFMEDSERAARLALDLGIDTGLHLNFTTALSAAHCPAKLADHQQRLGSHLLRHRLAQVFLHPGLMRSFEYVVAAQCDEFRRLYGSSPTRVDGHHHMHLCENMLFQKLLPAGILARRSFSFQPGEKSLANRMYRKTVDWRLAHRYRLTDYLFSLIPLAPATRLDRIRSLAQHSMVEVETHPIQPEEYNFLTGKAFAVWTADLPIARGFESSARRSKENAYGRNS